MGDLATWNYKSTTELTSGWSAFYMQHMQHSIGTVPPYNIAQYYVFDIIGIYSCTALIEASHKIWSFGHSHCCSTAGEYIIADIYMWVRTRLFCSRHPACQSTWLIGFILVYYACCAAVCLALRASPTNASEFIQAAGHRSVEPYVLREGNMFDNNKQVPWLLHLQMGGYTPYNVYEAIVYA